MRDAPQNLTRECNGDLTPIDHCVLKKRLRLHLVDHNYDFEFSSALLEQKDYDRLRKYGPYHMATLLERRCYNSSAHLKISVANSMCAVSNRTDA